MACMSCFDSIAVVAFLRAVSALESDELGRIFPGDDATEFLLFIDPESDGTLAELFKDAAM